MSSLVLACVCWKSCLILTVNHWSCLMSVVLQFRTIRNSTVAINDQWLLLKPELLWLLIVNALQLNELSALRNMFYPEYKYIYIYIYIFSGCMAQWSKMYVTSLLVDSEGASSNYGKALLFLRWLVCLYSRCWSFKVFVLEAMLSITQISCSPMFL